MRWVLRVALALGALIALVLVALAVVLPRWAGSAAVRARIEAAARDAIGREVRFETLEAGFLPPALRVVKPSVAGPRDKDPALLTAESVSLRLALLPLLSRTIAIDSLVVEGANVHLTRTRQGLDWPSPGKPDAGAETPAADAEPGADDSGSGGLALQIRKLSLRDSTLVLEDRAVTPATTWELRDLRADVNGRLLGERVDVEASGTLASGGSLHVEGDAGFDGALDLEAELTAIHLAPFAPYAAGVESLAGKLDGELRVVGRAADPERAAAVLDFAHLSLRRGALAIEGPLRVETDLATPLRAASGNLRAEADRAAIDFGDSFHKPAGTALQLEGRLAPAKGGGLALEDLDLLLRDAKLRGRVARLSPLELELQSEGIDLAGLDAIFPALAATQPTGKLRVESLAYTAQPQSLRGRVLLDGVEAHPAGRAPLALRGALLAQGQSLRLEEGRLASDGQELTLDAALEDLFGAPHYRVAVETARADANQVVSAFAGKKDAIFGLLGLQASFAGPLGGDLLQSLEGRAGFGVEEGRIAGVSLLRSTFEQLGSAGVLAESLGRAFGGRDLQRLYDDQFDALRGTFDVRGGKAKTDDLTFAYRGYQVVLRGTMGLADLALDTEGELTLDAEVDEQIAKALNLKNYTPVERKIPLASVAGTLSAPKVRLSPKTAAALAATYGAPRYLDPLREKAEKALGKDGGAVVDQGLEILDGLLGGGGRRREKPATEPAPPAPDEPAAADAQAAEQAPAASPAEPPAPADAQAPADPVQPAPAPEAPAPAQ